MTVQELIERLQKQDPKAEVKYMDYEDPTNWNSIDAIKVNEDKKEVYLL